MRRILILTLLLVLQACAVSTGVDPNAETTTSSPTATTVPVAQDVRLAALDVVGQLLDAVLDRSAGSMQQGVLRLPFHARRPFHPARLHAWLSDLPAGVVRARGSFWISSAPHIAAELDVALGDVQTAVAGHWWAAVPEAQRPSGPDFAAYVAGVWHPSFGDRRQELAFVGVDVDRAALLEGLQGCLLTDAELGQPDAWVRAGPAVQ